MLLLEANQIEKYYGDRLILSVPTFKVYQGDRIGLVGRNGSGKTTLLEILARRLTPDRGQVRHYCPLAYIRQFSAEEITADRRLLEELGLSNKVNQPTYSGGELTRIRIANALSYEPVLLLADEPGANLDHTGIRLLKEKLRSLESFILVSHDRTLLDELCNKIVEIQEATLTWYEGNFTAYLLQKDRELEEQRRAYENYVQEKRRLEATIRERMQKSSTMQKPPRRMGPSEARLHKAKGRAKQEKVHRAAKTLQTRLEQLEAVPRPQKSPEVKVDLSLTDPPENPILLRVHNLTFGYGPKVLVQGASFHIPRGSKTALWGANGTGKTTLLNLLFSGTHERIFWVPKAKLGYLHQGFENLDPRKSVLENVMESSVQTETVARTILARLLLRGDEVHKPVAVLSGGEKVKVSLAKLCVSSANVLLLDEPTNYLDLASRQAVEGVLQDYPGTVLFVSHDQAFVNAVATQLLIFEKGTIRPFMGNLEALKNKEEKGPDQGLTEMIRKMRLAELSQRLAEPGADKAALEAEWERIIKQLD
ncbi:MAG TPA: ABC-F type ribosomal protection protein [Firmicutes bacterium]|nr:ABC-F type ribosomal protection protein [Bacillota bacterium]